MAEPVDPPALDPEESSSALEAFNSVKVSLADLCAKGTAQYAHKNYEEAADMYARASEMQAELNGEMSPENAEILFLYGRALFKVGQSKSDVLGGRASGEKKKKKPNNAAKSSKHEPANGNTEKSELEKIDEEKVAIIAQQSAEGAKMKEEVDAKKPLFQFTGDENFEDSDDEDDAEAEEEEEEEEEELAAAFDVLEVARVLFEKKLEEPQEGEGKGKEIGDSPMTKHIKERLADTHDLLAEISLENENFPGAVIDFRAALTLKLGLFPEDSEILAEAHFKLSLALEFASITRTRPEDGEDANGEDESHIDQPMRDEAVRELEAALNCSKMKLKNKELELASSLSPDDNEVTIAQITDVKEIVADMENRLAELKAPPVDIKDVLYGPGSALGSAIGESPADAAARIQEAKKNANDLTGLVRHKKKPATDAATEALPSTNGKRKAENDAENSDSKKARVEDATEA